MQKMVLFDYNDDRDIFDILDYAVLFLLKWVYPMGSTNFISWLDIDKEVIAHEQIFGEDFFLTKDWWQVGIMAKMVSFQRNIRMSIFVIYNGEFLWYFMRKESDAMSANGCGARRVFLWSFGNVIFIFNNDDISFNMEILPQKMQAKCQWCHFLYGYFYTVFGFDSCKNDCDNNKIYNFMRLMEKIKSFLAFRISFDWNVQQATCQWCHFLWGLGNVIFIFNIKINKIYHFF